MYAYTCTRAIGPGGGGYVNLFFGRGVQPRPPDRKPDKKAKFAHVPPGVNQISKLFIYVAPANLPVAIIIWVHMGVHMGSFSLLEIV